MNEEIEKKSEALDLTKTLADIALKNLKDATKGFYAVDILFPNGELIFRGEAGFSFGNLLKFSALVDYNPGSKTFDAGIRIGGEFSL